LDAIELQQKLRETMGLRVGDEMARYIATKLHQPQLHAGEQLAIFAHDARTGCPLQEMLDPSVLIA
jgi:hypothetical protein